MRGEGTYLSDIDLVVIYDEVIAARRESFLMDDIPTEAFVHDRGTLTWFINDDVSRGRPSILSMIAEGTLIGAQKWEGVELRARINARLAEGPQPLTSAALNALRYEITDAVDDLRGNRTSGEMMAIGTLLYPKLVELALRGRGRWNGAGKWAPRLLRELSPDLADAFEGAFRNLFAVGDASAVIELAEAELQPHGGGFFEGDCRTAPETWRVAEGQLLPD